MAKPRSSRIQGPFGEGPDPEEVKLRVYLDQKVYDDLCKKAEERGLLPSQLLAHVLSDWAGRRKV